jgi:thiol:disulfide interchange protein DsbD
VYAKALASGSPTIIDFTAEWCIPCKEFEALTFPDPRVIAAAEGFNALRVDGTFELPPATQAVVDRHGVRGYPTILFIDSAGNERSDLRLVGFADAERFEGLLRAIH